MNTVGSELNHTVSAFHRHQFIHTQLNGFLNHPVHLFAFEQGLAKDQTGCMAGWFLDCIENASGDGSFGHVGDFGAVPMAGPVAEQNDLADGDA